MVIQIYKYTGYVRNLVTIPEKIWWLKILLQFHVIVQFDLKYLRNAICGWQAENSIAVYFAICAHLICWTLKHGNKQDQSFDPPKVSDAKGQCPLEVSQMVESDQYLLVRFAWYRSLPTIFRPGTDLISLLILLFLLFLLGQSSSKRPKAQ